MVSRDVAGGAASTSHAPPIQRDEGEEQEVEEEHDLLERMEEVLESFKSLEEISSLNIAYLQYLEWQILEEGATKVKPFIVYPPCQGSRSSFIKLVLTIKDHFRLYRVKTSNPHIWQVIKG